MSLAKSLNLSESPFLPGIESDIALSTCLVLIHLIVITPMVQISDVPDHKASKWQSWNLNLESLLSATKFSPIIVLWLPKQAYHGN